MLPPVERFESDTHLPEEADVAVIGGGILGASTAMFLARSGLRVVLCEKGYIAGEQSGRNQGWIRATNRDRRELPLVMEAMRYWNGMDELVQGDTGFRRCGLLFFNETDAKVALRQSWLDSVKDYQFDVRMVGGRELEGLLPGAAWRPKAALYAPSDGRAEPQKATPAIARAAQSSGATILENCAVRMIDLAAGRVAGVVTERGRIRCNAVVLAGGAWSSYFLRTLGIELPQLKIHSSIMKVSGIELGFEHSISTAKFGFRRRLDGGYTVASSRHHMAPLIPDSFRFFKDFIPILRKRWKTLPLRLGQRFFEELTHRSGADATRISAYERDRTLDPHPRSARSVEAKADLEALFPAFRDARIEAHWAGYVDVTPDEMPVISAVPGVDGLVVATGFSGHGFALGPAAGKLAADLLTGHAPAVDPRPFRFSRFAEGDWHPTEAVRA